MCLVSPVESGGRFVQGLCFQDFLGWPFSDAHCLKMAASAPYTWVSSRKEEERQRQGLQHLNPSATLGDQSLVQKLHPADMGSHLKNQIWVTWLPQLPWQMGKLELEFPSLHRRGSKQPQYYFCHLCLLYYNRMPNEPDSEDLKNLPGNYIFLRYPPQSLQVSGVFDQGKIISPFLSFQLKEGIILGPSTSLSLFNPNVSFLSSYKKIFFFF